MPLRKALLISTNNRIDRDNEIVSHEALKRYVEMCHDEQGNYIGNNKMLWWHNGDSIGRIIDCTLAYGFLVEIAQELPDTPVNIGTPDDKPFLTTIKDCWDVIEKNQDILGVSQGFLFDPQTQQDGVFRDILKYESSILPLESASNPYTFVRVLPNESDNLT